MTARAPAVKMNARAKVGSRGVAVLSRQCACGQHTVASGPCEACRKGTALMQRRSGTQADPGIVPPLVHEVLRSPGQPLDRAFRSLLEPRLGHDFSRVRLHADARAAQSAEAVDALAYTVGTDVVFGAGQYSPRTPAGRRLLVHELAHVVQQTTGRSDRALAAPDSFQLEREADQVSADIIFARAAPPQLSSAPRGMLQRQQKGTAPVAPAPPQNGHIPIPDAGRDRARFDAVFDWSGDAGTLTVTMRVGFTFQNDQSADHPWTALEMSKFKTEFIKENQRRWSDRYVLVPDAPCAKCSAKQVQVAVVPVEDSAKPHVTFLVDNAPFGISGVSPLDSTGHLHIGDVQQHRNQESGTYQTTGEHEFGHALGLHHISCSSNDVKCYGAKGSADEKDIMGKGSEVSARDYEIFTEVMRGATGCAWHAEPKSSSIWPLIALGAAVAIGVGIGIGFAASGGKK